MSGDTSHEAELLSAERLAISLDILASHECCSNHLRLVRGHLAALEAQQRTDRETIAKLRDDRDVLIRQPDESAFSSMAVEARLEEAKRVLELARIFFDSKDGDEDATYSAVASALLERPHRANQS